MVCKPGTVSPHKKFEAEIYCLTKEEGGRHTPFFSNYRPQFFFRTADVSGGITLPEVRSRARLRRRGLFPLRSSSSTEAHHVEKRRSHHQEGCVQSSRNVLGSQPFPMR
jgi:hypothetical protein